MVQIFAEIPSDHPEEIFEVFNFVECICQATPLPVDCPTFVQFFMVAVASQSVKFEKISTH